MTTRNEIRFLQQLYKISGKPRAFWTEEEADEMEKAVNRLFSPPFASSNGSDFEDGQAPTSPKHGPGPTAAESEKTAGRPVPLGPEGGQRTIQLELDLSSSDCQRT